MRLVAMLEEGRCDFLEAIGGISADLASAMPGLGQWSVLQCIEHVATVEDRYLSLLANGTEPPPRRDSRREMRLSLAMGNRATKVESPDSVRPSGRLSTLPEAMAEFESARQRTLRFAEDRGDALYAMGARHPFFGVLNGVEWMQLIDGHARRHAEQIRETHTALLRPRRNPMRPAQRKKAAGFHRDTPDLPAELDPAEDPDGLFDDPESVAIQEVRLHSLERRNLRADNLRIEGSVLEQVQLEGGVWNSAVWKDVRLVQCDLANIRVRRLTLVRVELIDCRLTGFAATTVDAQDVLIRNGDLRYAQFQEGAFRACEFENCNWEDADLQRSDLSGCLLRGCNLARADLQGAKLHDTDFRGSEVDGMVVGMTDLRGAIVDPAQAMVFAKTLGLQIR